MPVVDIDSAVDRARADLDKSRRRLDRLEQKIRRGTRFVWLQAWREERHARQRMDWELRRRSWEALLRLITNAQTRKEKEAS